MNKTLVLFQVVDIHPDSKTTCSGRCSWRDGHDCSLFKVRLKPAPGIVQSDTRCFRSDHCKAAEKNLVYRLADNGGPPEGEEGEAFSS